MCGIVGAIWNKPSAAIDIATLEEMAERVAHWGPDDKGCYLRPCRGEGGSVPIPGVALGHRRLSIIDVVGSRQPLANEDETIWAVFNGEIYNFRELRRRLEGSGHRFRTAGDTETIVHLYEDEGPEFARHLWGMFAIALWDSRQRQLVLVRDRLGKKPLVYRFETDRLLFASELKCLLAVPGVPRDVDPEAIDEFLTYQYVPHPNTIFRGIRKLPPAHYAVWRDGQMRIDAYWQPDFSRQIERPWHVCVAELRELLTDAVRLRMQSDVPLGAFLSGGVDSSIIVGLMKRLAEGGDGRTRETASKMLRRGGGNGAVVADTGGRIKTFSIGFADAQFDETAFARQVAERFGTEHHVLTVETSGIDLLPKLAWHFDEPMADSSAIPTWHVAGLARRDVTVALTGDGGDELFAGYDRYRAVWISAMLDRLPGQIRRLLASRFWQRFPTNPGRRSIVRRLRRLSAVLNLPMQQRYLDWIGIFNESARAGLYTDDFLSQLNDVDPAEFLQRAWRRSGRRDSVTAASLADLTTYLPCDLLVKVDIASMAHGLECRQPFLDHRLVEWAAALPARYKQRLGRGKRILRETFRDLLPADVRRRPKMGFGVPMDSWLRGELKDFARQTLLDSRATGRGYFRPQSVAQLLDEHQSGRINHGHRIWSLLVLELWHRQWVDNSGVPSPARR